jgi:YidC/Oxa1 family membrane protein insertase
VEDRRLLLFFLLSLAILLGWQMLMPKAAPHPPTPTAAPAATATAATPRGGVPAAARPASAAAPAPVPAGPPITATAEQRLVVDTAELRAVFTNRGAQLLSFELKQHHDEKGRPLELVRARQQGPWPLGLVAADGSELPLDQALFAAHQEKSPDGADVLRFDYRGPAGSAHKVVRLEAMGVIGLEVQASPSGWGVVLGPGLRNPSSKELDSKRQPRQAVYRVNGKVETVLAPRTEGLVKVPVAGLSWIGLEDNYFLTVLVPQSPLAAVVLEPVAISAAEPGRPYRLLPFRNEDALPAADRELPRDLRIIVRPRGQALTATLYLGAKQYERLARLPWGLEETLQWGMWGFLSRPLLWALLWIHDHMVPNYGWAIVLLTLGLRVLMLPITLWGQKSMQRMQDLQPRLQAIRQKYRGKLKDSKGRMDLEAQRRMNEEMQELFRSEGANPYGGCLPIIVQIPVFFALFAMLRSAVELRDAPWALWIHDLAVPDPYFILPIVMGATQIYQQRLTPMSGDPMQRRLMQLFPWMFTVFSLSFPAGLVLYWTVNNVVTIVQTLVLNKQKQATGGKGKRKAARAARGERS